MKIKNWSQFQHFKDRRPPWIKLYRDILDDIEWHELDPKSAKVLVMLWLIASENEGTLPDTKRLAFRLRMSEKDVDGVISKLSHWLEHGDTGVISSRYQDDLPETETETDTDTETEKEKELSVEPQSDSPPAFLIPVVGGKQFGVSRQMVEEWQAAYPGVDVPAELLKIRAWSLSNPAKQKTLGGALRFINLWLAKTQDQVGKVPDQRSQNVGERNAAVLQGLTRGLVGGDKNVKLLGK